MSESLLTPELLDAAGRQTPPREVTVTRELVQRVIETVEDEDPRWSGAGAPPYTLMAFETSAPYPEPADAPMSLVTGDEWTLHRPLQIGDRLTYTGGIASVHERFGSRFGHNLVLRFGWTFRDVDGAVVAEVGRGMIRYRAPDPEPHRIPAGTPEPPRVAGNGRPPDIQPDPPTGGVARIAPVGPGVAQGDPLPPLMLRPSYTQVVRYCGLTWNFTPIFFDPEEARRAGLPGTIVPGPLKIALLTRYLAAWAGPAGEVRSVRAAHRRPDLTARPITVRGAVNQVTVEDGRRLVNCDVWFENETAERSLIGSASVMLS